MRNGSRRRMPATGLAIASVSLAACTAIPAQTARLGDGPPGTAFPGSVLAASPASSQNLVSNQSGALTGIVMRPDPGLIANNSGALIDVGTGVFLTDPGTGVFWRAPFRLAGLSPSLQTSDPLPQSPVAGTRASLFVTRESGATAVKVGEALTDPEGRYSFRLPASSSGTVLVEVPFDASGESFTFSNVASLPATGDLEVPVDAVTTLVVEGLAAGSRETLGGQLLRTPGVLTFAQGVVSRLRQELTRDDLPFMGRRSRDLRNFLAQRMEDFPDLPGLAGGVVEFIRRRADRFEVETVFRGADLFPAAFPVDDHAGFFEVAPSGDVLLPRWVRGGVNSRIEVVSVRRVGGAIATASVGLTPPGYRAPALMGQAPDGTLYLAAVKVDNQLGRELTCFRLPPGSDTFVQVGSNSLSVAAGEVIARADRLAVGKMGDVVLAIPGQQVVHHLPPGAGSAWRILAGAPDATGSADGVGPAARFFQPGSPGFGPDGHVLVADRSSRAIRQIVLATGAVTTVGGMPGEPEGDRNGRARRALFRRPYSLAVQGYEVFITDPNAQRIRRLSADGGTFVVAGTGRNGSQDGPGTQATFTAPYVLRSGASGEVWVLDGDNAVGPSADIALRRIRRVQDP